MTNLTLVIIVIIILMICTALTVYLILDDRDNGVFYVTLDAFLIGVVMTVFIIIW